MVKKIITSSDLVVVDQIPLNEKKKEQCNTLKYNCKYIDCSSGYLR